MPADKAISPLDRFSPFLLMKCFIDSCWSVTLLSSVEVNSTCKIESAPLGIGAPVIILTAWPFCTVMLSSCPAAWIVPIISNVAGTSVVSSNLIAKPSIAELSNGGSSTKDGRSTAKIRPWELSRFTLSVTVCNVVLLQISNAWATSMKYGNSPMSLPRSGCPWFSRS